MRRLVVGLVLSGAMLLGAGPVAAQETTRDVCLSLGGAPAGATAEQIADGIRDGTITVVATCSDHAPGPTLAADDAGAWVVGEIESDPITDAAAATSILPAEGSSTIALIVRCRAPITEVFIGWSDYLADNDRVTLRLDDEEPVERSWPMSTDSTATFYPGNGDTFAKTLLAHEVMVARVTPYNSGPLTATFQLAGIETALAPVREACGW